MGVTTDTAITGTTIGITTTTIIIVTVIGFSLSTVAPATTATIETSPLFEVWVSGSQTTPDRKATHRRLDQRRVYLTTDELVQLRSVEAQRCSTRLCGLTF